MPTVHTVLFTRESQYLTGLIACELAQAAHFEMEARKPRHEQDQPASLPGTGMLAPAAERGPPALPLDDKVSKRKGEEMWCKKGTVDLNPPRVVKA